MVLKDSGADVRPVAFALVYAKKGWPILPLHTADDKGCSCGKADCSSPGKHPRTKHGVKDATKDGDRIRLWWEKWPDANMGIATGKVSNVVVLDVDPGHGGQESLARLEQDHGLLPQTLEQKTGGGGRHLVFKRPGMAARSRVGVAPGLDIRANGGYIVVSPSLHASGERYIWVNGGNPLALMPQWLEDIVSHNGRNSEGLSPSVAGSISQGERNNTLASLAGAMRHRGMTQESILAALLQENERRCDPPLDDKEVETIAKSISRYDPTDEEAFSSYSASSAPQTPKTCPGPHSRRRIGTPDGKQPKGGKPCMGTHSKIWNAIRGTIKDRLGEERFTLHFKAKLKQIDLTQKRLTVEVSDGHEVDTKMFQEALDEQCLSGFTVEFDPNGTDASKDEFFGADATPRNEIIEGLVREGQLVVLGGAFGVGKSPTLVDLVVRLLNERPWCGRSVTNRPVVVIDFENSGDTYRKNLQNICGRLNADLPKVPDELEVYLEQDSPGQSATRKLLDILKAPVQQRLDFIREALQRKPNALVIIDPVEMLFRTDTLKKQNVLGLYTELRFLLADFPTASILMTFNLRKRDRNAGRPSLLTNPRGWLEEVCGSLDIMNRSDVRLGMDFLDENEDVRVINGVRRGEEMHPLLIRPAGDPDRLAGFELCPASEVDLVAALTPRQREHWTTLPEEFRFESVADTRVPRASLFRLINRAKSLGLLKEEAGTYKKVKR